MIWWLASYPKSGNTWLRMFLSAYRNGGRVDINNPSGLLVDDISTYFHQIVSPVPLADLKDEQQILLRPAALLHLTKVSRRSEPLFVKTHFANCAIGGICTIPPVLTYGAVYIVRDPRDVVVSFAEHRACDIDGLIEAMARRDHMIRAKPLYQHLASWSEHVKSWAIKTRFPTLVVHYEDLLKEPIIAFRKILEFTRHEVDEELLVKSVGASSFDALRAQEDARGFREKAKGERFFNKGKAGGWRDVLTPEQAEMIVYEQREMMQEFGYVD